MAFCYNIPSFKLGLTSNVWSFGDMIKWKDTYWSVVLPDSISLPYFCFPLFLVICSIKINWVVLVIKPLVFTLIHCRKGLRFCWLADCCKYKSGIVCIFTLSLKLYQFFFTFCSLIISTVWHDSRHSLLMDVHERWRPAGMLSPTVTHPPSPPLTTYINEWKFCDDLLTPSLKSPQALINLSLTTHHKPLPCLCWQ